MEGGRGGKERKGEKRGRERREEGRGEERGRGKGGREKRVVLIFLAQKIMVDFTDNRPQFQSPLWVRQGLVQSCRDQRRWSLLTKQNRTFDCNYHHMCMVVWTHHQCCLSSSPLASGHSHTHHSVGTDPGSSASTRLKRKGN